MKLQMAKALCCTALWTAVVCMFTGCVVLHTQGPVFETDQAVQLDGTVNQTYMVKLQPKPDAKDQRPQYMMIRGVSIDDQQFMIEYFDARADPDNLEEADVNVQLAVGRAFELQPSTYLIDAREMMAGEGALQVANDVFVYGVLLVRPDEMAVVTFVTVKRKQLQRVAEKHGLEVSGSYLIEGDLTPENLKQFFLDILMDEQLVTALTKSVVKFSAVDAWPAELEDRSYEAMFASTWLNPYFAGTPQAFEFSTYVQALHNQGNPWATYMLGRLYANGFGVPKDLEVAQRYGEQAVEEGVPQAHALLGYLAIYGEASANVNRGIVHLQKAIEADSSLGMMNLYHLYADGMGVEQDKEMAMLWLKRAAEAENAIAMTRLGMMYLDGDGVEQDEKQAWSLFKKAASQKFPMAYAMQGLMYEQGRYQNQDEEKAVEKYQQAAELGNPFALYQMGRRRIEGQGVERDVRQGLDELYQAHQMGQEQALEMLVEYGVLTEDGERTSQEQRKEVLDRLVAENELKQMALRTKRDAVVKKMRGLLLQNMELLAKLKNNKKELEGYLTPGGSRNQTVLKNIDKHQETIDRVWQNIFNKQGKDPASYAWQYPNAAGAILYSDGRLLLLKDLPDEPVEDVSIYPRPGDRLIKIDQAELNRISKDWVEPKNP